MEVEIWHLYANSYSQTRPTKLWASKDLDDIIDQAKIALKAQEIRSITIECDMVNEEEDDMDLQGVDGFGISSMIEEFLGLDFDAAEQKALKNGMKVRILKAKTMDTQEDVDEEAYDPTRINFMVDENTEKVTCASIG